MEQNSTPGTALSNNTARDISFGLNFQRPIVSLCRRPYIENSIILACAATEAVDHAEYGDSSEEHVTIDYRIGGLRRDRPPVAQDLLPVRLGDEKWSQLNTLNKTSDFTFRVFETDDGWRVSRGQSLYGDFLTRGDAVRAACFGARAANKRGAASLVVVAPEDHRIDPYEAHFDA